jgi:hypothetical protein
MNAYSNSSPILKLDFFLLLGCRNSSNIPDARSFLDL